MLWRALSALILLFWAVMTGLLLRDTYFPDQSRFTEVPAQKVFDLFLADASTFNNTLHLYKNDARLGHATFTARRLQDGTQALAYAIVATGNVRLEHLPSLPDGKAPEANFHLRGELLHAEQWRTLELEVRIPSSEIHARISWREGTSLPEVSVQRGTEALMTTETLHSMLALSGVTGIPHSLTPPATSSSSSKPMIHAREGIMDLAGKRRKCHILTASLLGNHQARAFFTEAGALARLELPDGYTLLEPLMHGLSLEVD